MLIKALLALVGLAISLGGGWFCVPRILGAVRKYQGLGEKPKRSGVPPELTGTIERLFFTIIVAFDVSGAATAMIGWETLKLLTNWNRQGTQSEKDQEQWRAWAFSALIGGLASMLFALIGGLVWRGKL
jgi:hypothetical protein